MVARLFTWLMNICLFVSCFSSLIVCPDNSFTTVHFLTKFYYRLLSIQHDVCVCVCFPFFFFLSSFFLCAARYQAMAYIEASAYIYQDGKVLV